MSPKRFSQYVANLCPVPARPVLAVLGLFVGLAALAGLLLLLSPGPAPVIAAPPEEPHMAITIAAPMVEDRAVAEPAPVIAAAMLSPGEATTTTVTSSPNPSAFGQTVTFTATVGFTGVTTPTGTVTFKDGGAALGTGTLNASSVATFTTCTLDVGTHTVTAEYGGDANFNASTSAPLTQVVDKAEPTVTLDVAPSPSVFGETITLTATVTSAVCTDLAVAPTGVVFFNDRGVTIGTAALNASGVATMTTFSLVAGEHPLTAVYSGDENHKASESAPLTHTVNKADTSTTLSSSDPTPVFGQCLTFTATVAISETVSTPATAGTPTGIVTFQDVFTDTTGTPIVTTIGSGTLNGEGVAGFTTCSLAVGDHTIIATYEGDDNFNQSQTSMTFTVDKANTTTGIVDAVRSPSVYGESVTFTAVVSATLPGAGTPTGKVVFKVDGTAVFTGTLGFTNPGEARWTTTPGDSTELDTDPADGNHTITVFYSGDGNFNSSDNSASPFTQRVNKANTTVQLQIPLDETEFGQDVQMSAHVSVDAPGAGMPTGTVTFTVNTTPQMVITGTLPEGVTSVTVVTNTIPFGTWNVQAQYSGDKHFNGDTSDPVEHKVNKAKSKTSLTSAPNPSDFGQTAVFTATVIPAGASTSAITPTGTVTFTFNSYMTGTLNVQGVATVTTDTLPAGTYNVTADYGGDGNFLSSSATRSHTVNRLATTTTLSSSHSPANTSVIGESVTFTATVTATGGITPTGTVDLWDGVRVIDSDTLDASGQATFTKSDLAAGTHPIKAVYTGTPNFSPSSSERLFHTVTAADSTTTLTSSPPSPTVFGQTVTFTATVTGGGATPTGQVTFKDGAATIGTETLVGGVATLSKSDLSVGTHTITAVYGGDSNYAGSSDSTSHTVDKANTTTTIDSVNPVSPTVVGQPVTVSFTVVASGAGSGNPTGNVTVSDGTDSCVGSVGSAGSCTLIPTTAGHKTLTATYAGDSNFNGSSDNTQTHQVNKADTTTTVTSSPNPSLPGQNVTITANVTANPPGAGTPTGTVTFTVEATTVAVPLSGGSASTIHSFGAEGAFPITADYSGDGNFKASSGPTTHNVSATPADLSVTKTDSPDPVNVGDDLTYIIAVTNHGTVSTTVTLTDTLPSQVTFGSVDPPSCSHSGGTVTCNLGIMASGANATVTIIVTVPITTPAGTVLRNTAEVKGTRPEPVPDPHPNTSTEETTVYRSPRLGDCNGDDTVSLADVWSIVRDIFDPTFQGTSGCDANKDSRVDAGDVPSTVLIMFNGARSQGRRGADSLDPFSPAPLLLCSSAPLPGPALAMPGQVSASPGGLATVPVSFAANGHSITSLAFSVDYDETWLALDPADQDGNGIPDAVVFSLPGDFTASVTFDESDADGEVDVFIGDIAPPLTSLSDGPIVFLILNVASSPGRMQGAVLFSLDPVASFGNTSGQSVPGTATPTVRYQHQIYLPVVVR